MRTRTLHTPLRLLALLLLALCGSLQAAAQRSSFLPSLHHERYDAVHSYARTISSAHEQRTQKQQQRETAHTQSTATAQPHTQPPRCLAAAPALPLFPQTFPHSVWLLRVKVPFTASRRAALADYVAPYELGDYVPHHAFLITVGRANQQQQQEDESTAAAAAATATIHPAFDLSASGAHALHPARQLYAHHLTANQTLDQTRHWLAAAPGVLFVRPWAAEHKVHPKLRAQLSDQLDDSDAAAAAEEAERTDEAEAARWNSAVFGSKSHAQTETRRTRAHFSIQQLHARLGLPPSSVSRSAPSSSTHARSFLALASARPLQSLPSDARPFHMLHLRVHLHPHPLLERHAARALLQSSGLEHDHPDRVAAVQQHATEIEHSMSVLRAWADMLEAIEAPLPSRAIDAAWLRRHGSGSSISSNNDGSDPVTTPHRFSVSTSLYDARSPAFSDHSYTSSLLRQQRANPWFVHLSLLTPRVLNVHVSSWFVSALVDGFLALRHEVSWVSSPLLPPVSHNRFVRPLIQSDRGNDSSIFRRSHDRLRGQAQVVQLGDTGLDVDSCFFADPQRAVALNSFDGAHRKIVGYHLFENADLGDDAAGHGSHVGGSLAGDVLRPSSAPGSGGVSVRAYATLSPYGGMAPDARLAFYDFKRSGSEELAVPQTVYAPFLGDGYTAGGRAGAGSLSTLGARISSNSWGSPDGEYGSYCLEIDQFCADFPDSLVLFAAGNYGEAGWNSLSSPGVAKNALTVGSTKTSPASFLDAGIDVGIQIVDHPPAGEAAGADDASSADLRGRKFQVSEAGFGVDFSKVTGMDGAEGVAVIVADPADACVGGDGAPAALRNDLSLAPGLPDAPLIMLVRRGTCHFDEKALAVQRLGSRIKVMIVVNNAPGPPIHMGAEGRNAAAIRDLAAVMIGSTIGESLMAHASAVRLRAPVQVDPPDENERVLSSFSSRGPAFGGRIEKRPYGGRLKPDLLAPGEFVRSVRSDGRVSEGTSCPEVLTDGIMELEGTSMATPVVAGAAAIVRQYLREGWFPSGAPNASHAWAAPPSALLKALLIHSAVSASGEVVTQSSSAANDVPYTVAVAPAPSNFQGFGRLLLEHVLLVNETRVKEQEDAAARAAQQPVMPDAPPQEPLSGPAAIPQPNMDLPSAAADVASADAASSLRRIGSDEIHSYCYEVSARPGWFDAASGGQWIDLAQWTREQSAQNETQPRPSMPGFRATLVWTDAPSAAGSSFVLVNNLDLFVSDVRSKRTWLGNALDYTAAGEQHAQWDLENNVEQVSISLEALASGGGGSSEAATDPPTRMVAVHVRGTHVPSAQAQAYALVVSGWFNDSRSEFDSAGRALKQRPLGACVGRTEDGSGSATGGSGEDHLGILCPGNCGESLGRGNCSYTTALCSCVGEWGGDDCSVLSTALAASTDAALTWSMDSTIVPVDGWIYVHFSFAEALFPAAAAAAPSTPAPSSPAEPAVLDAASVLASLTTLLSNVESFSFLMQRSSSKGDPDWFASWGSNAGSGSLGGAYPTLRVHSASNTDCDSCAVVQGPQAVALGANNTPGRSRAVKVSKQRMLNGMGEALKAAALSTAGSVRTGPEIRALIDTALKVRIGFHGYCCDASSASFVFSPVYPASSTGPAWKLWGTLLGVAAVLLVLGLAARVWRKRRAERRLQDGMQMMPLPRREGSGGGGGSLSSLRAGARSSPGSRAAAAAAIAGASSSNVESERSVLSAATPSESDLSVHRLQSDADSTDDSSALDLAAGASSPLSPIRSVIRDPSQSKKPSTAKAKFSALATEEDDEAGERV